MLSLLRIVFELGNLESENLRAIQISLTLYLNSEFFIPQALTVLSDDL